MLKSSNSKRLVITVAAMAAAVTPLLAGSASADPKQLTAFVGVGSDTTQDVVNALAGESNGILYTPVASSAASGRVQIVSYNALNPTNPADSCFTPTPGGPTTQRPNGSGSGQKALSRAIAGGGWGVAACGGVQDVSGLIQFSRSSSGPSNAVGTDLTFIPFGRDALSFAYYRAGGNGGPVTTLTRQQLQSLYSGGNGSSLSVSNGTENVTIIACGIQTGSGTYNFWRGTALGVTAAQDDTATSVCNALGTGVRLEENDAAGLKAKGDLVPAGTQVIIGFSASSFVAKSNGVSSNNPATSNVGLGSISDNGSGVNLGSPVTGVAPNMAPQATFYNSSIFGRNVYNVLPTAFATGAGNNDYKSLFVGSTSAICQATTTIQTFGYLTLGANCGTTILQGGLVAGSNN
ncbi:MAG: hypothetical protein WCC60_14120 [Ilumatobacteraceae bacterium]